MPSLTSDSYGKTRVRLTQVTRTAHWHELVELAVDIFFQGEFAKSFTAADNSAILPTDTIKNTVYALARLHPIETIEEFSRVLARHFLLQVAHLREVRIEITQMPWKRIESSESAFALGGQDRRTASLTAARDSEQMTSGVHGLEILKTANAAFSGFIKDAYTTLAETRDRLLGTVLDADWTYKPGAIDYNCAYNDVCTVLLQSFAAHASESVQHTLYFMAQSALRSCHLGEIHLVMPNKHRLLVDLARFGLDNPNQIFVPTDEPSGYIEARVSTY